jgi:hypothetical protein
MYDEPSQTPDPLADDAFAYGPTPEPTEPDAETPDEPQGFEVIVEDENGDVFVGRITGKAVAYSRRTEATVYLTTDERVLVHDPDKRRVWDVTDDPEAALRDGSVAFRWAGHASARKGGQLRSPERAR